MTFWIRRSLAMASVVLMCVWPASALAQAGRGRLLITVTDMTGAVLPDADVKIAGVETATRAAVAPVKTSPTGVATLEGLAPGRYSIEAEFPGFEKTIIKDARVRAGDNRQTLVLNLKTLSDTVNVGPDRQEAGSSRASTFGSLLTRSQIDELSDDPAIMRQQLEDLAGPGMTIAVDSFEGGQLPNKSQIRSIRISRDQFAAESHFAGGIRIEIVTQPGTGAIRGNVNTNFYTSAMDGRNPLVNAAPPSQNRNGGVNLSGGILKDRMSFSLNVRGSNNFLTPVQASSVSGGTAAQVLGITNRTKDASFSGGFDLALTKDQTLRFGATRQGSSNTGSGLGVYDSPERNSSGEDTYTYVQAGHTGPIGRRSMLYNRFTLVRSDSTARSAVEEMTFIVPDDLNRGGAQRRGTTTSTSINLNSDLDHVRGRHSFRSGVEVSGTSYRSDSESNYLGTYYFEGPEAFAAGRPRSFTKRIGDPNIRYTNTQVGVYFQDDIRISKTLTMTPGVRYEVQSIVKDYNNIMPRFGVTWAPGAGKTTYRASLGIFYDWFSTGTYQQSLQFDGFRMQEVNVANPQYPDPGPLGAAAPVQRYLIGDDLVLPRTGRASLGISHTFNTLLQASGVYAYTRSVGQYVGENLNAPVNGVRPDPAFANVIRATSNGKAEQHSLNASLSLNLAGLGANPTTGPFFQWRRGLRISGSYGTGTAYTNTDGAFSTPATDLASEWGPSAGDIRHRGSISFGTAIIRGLSSSVNFSASSARPLTIRTGSDDNGDLIYNDRPFGVGRNSARVPGQWNSNANFGYTFSLGRRMVASGGGVSITSSAGGGYAVNMTGSQPQPRYRLSINLGINNLFNRPVYGGYSGVMTSGNFMRPTSATGVRRTSINMSLSF